MCVADLFGAYFGNGRAPYGGASSPSPVREGGAECMFLKRGVVVSLRDPLHIFPHKLHEEPKSIFIQYVLRPPASSSVPCSCALSANTHRPSRPYLHTQNWPLRDAGCSSANPEPEPTFGRAPRKSLDSLEHAAWKRLETTGPRALSELQRPRTGLTWGAAADATARCPEKEEAQANILSSRRRR